jgi:curli production assembly/transport component CsgF
MMIKNILRVIFILVVLGSTEHPLAQQLVYTPDNPSFGGNPLNGNWMLSQAQVQNGFTAGAQIDSRLQQNPLTDFTESLNRQILSQLSRGLISSIFGESGLEEGRYEIGNYTIDILQGADGISIVIFDLSTGDETRIIVPYF